MCYGSLLILSVLYEHFRELRASPNKGQHYCHISSQLGDTGCIIPGGKGYMAVNTSGTIHTWFQFNLKCTKIVSVLGSTQDAITALLSPPIAGFCLNQFFKGRGNGLVVEPPSQNREGPGSIPRLGKPQVVALAYQH